MSATEAILQYRQKIIDRIESFTGALELPYDQIITEDLQKLCDAIETNWENISAK